MLSSGKPSKFIDEIDAKYLRMKKNTIMRSYSNVSLEEYLFSDKILNKYLPEEKIRQWVLRELKDSYMYPVEGNRTVPLTHHVLPC